MFSTCASTDLSSADTASSRITSRGLQRQRAGDVDALALAARQLVRIAVGEAVRDRARPWPAGRARASRASAAGRPCALGAKAMRLGDGQARVERGVGVLEHHLHLAAQLVARVMPCGSSTGSPSNTMVPRVRLDQPHQQARHRRLAAARLADDAQGLALGDREARRRRRRAPPCGRGRACRRRTGKCLRRPLPAAAAGPGRRDRADREARDVHVRPSRPWRRAGRRSSG